ncbi:MAG: amidohydrolase [Planctomycetaceae bacterium]|nr:amidohydrolase [Planctomycetaceae bacterium]|tara:strand:- start:123 stop:476 length:354 start_codon:yes stop_codon:yes gene_type:complete
MSDESELMRQLDIQLSHIWMVRTFLKHSDEAEEDEELALVHRRLYDFSLALGSHLNAGDAEGYLKQANKRWRRLRDACELFSEIQPEISNHTNFKMAAMSLKKAVFEIGRLLGKEEK